MKKQLLHFITILLILSGLLSSCNIATAQSVFKGILWVVPIDSSALPINGTTTGNEDLNRIFEKFHVEKYYFLDSLAIGLNENVEIIYEIQMNEEFAHLEWNLNQELFYCYQMRENLFKYVGRPYYYDPQYGYFNTILIPYFDPSVLPCSPISSCNEQLNAILENYNILNYFLDYFVFHGDTIIKLIVISCEYPEVVMLYKELISLKPMVENFGISLANMIMPDISYPCEYIGISSENSPPLIVYPNPATDYIDISGISPQIITLYDLQGRIVLSKTNTNYIEIGHLPKGLYFLHIFSDKGDFFAQKLNKM